MALLFFRAMHTRSTIAEQSVVSALALTRQTLGFAGSAQSWRFDQTRQWRPAMCPNVQTRANRSLKMASTSTATLLTRSAIPIGKYHA